MSVVERNSLFVKEQSLQTAKISGIQESLLQEIEKDILYYRDNFVGKGSTFGAHIDHQNFLSISLPTVAISAYKDGEIYKVLIRTDQVGDFDSKGSERVEIDGSKVPRPWYKRLFNLSPAVNEILEAISHPLTGMSFRQIRDPNFHNELLIMEERQVIRSYKFGLLYAGPNQSTEEEVFQNTQALESPKFVEFLSFLGEKVDLKGWTAYRAGLDVNNGQTGHSSVYTKWQGYEIMFHVAAMLPHSQTDSQQLERKRHIGNDIVVIIFQESDSPFQLNTITSKQNHVIFVVKPVGKDYSLTVCSKQGVPAFKPEIPEPTIFSSNPVSRDFFFHKLINGERASYKSPDFAPKIARTRGILLSDLSDRFLD